ncbi:MAG: hypothetical protein ABIQ57_01565 [Candidatus Kapaibacterium sp.]
MKMIRRYYHAREISRRHPLASRSGYGDLAELLDGIIYTITAHTRPRIEIRIAQLPGFENAIRGSRFSESAPHWSDLAPEQFAKLHRIAPMNAAELGLICFHRDGYVRERATDFLREIDDGSELPFLILRASDLVSQVRDAAIKALRERLTTDYCRHWTDSLPLIERLREVKHLRGRWLINAVDTLLRHSDCRDALMNALDSDDPSIRRSTWILCARNHPIAAGHLRRGLCDDDRLIRKHTIDQIETITDDHLFTELMTIAIADSSTGLRAAAASMLGRRNPDAAADLLRPLLFDSSLLVRATVQHYLRNRVGPESESELEIDIPEIYRREILRDDDRTIIEALAGLAETGSSADALLAGRFRDHRLSRVRRIATKAYLHLADRIASGELLEILSDRTPRVSRKILSAAERHLNLLTIEDFRLIFFSFEHPHVLNNLLILTRRCSKWDQIILLLENLPVTNEQSKRAAIISEIEFWRSNYNHRLTSPTQKHREQLTDLLERNGSFLTAEQRSDLTLIAKTKP